MNSSNDEEYVNINQSLVDNIYIYNTTDLGENESGNLLFEFILILSLVILCSGTIVNLVLATGIWRKKNKGNGILRYILQLCILDAIGVSSAGLVELYTFYQKSWTLGPLACRLYLGAETFTGAMIAYTLLCLDLHTLVKASAGRTRHRKRQHNDDMDSECTSQHSLVSMQSGERNIVTVDYRQNPSQGYTISSTMPTALVWFIAASLSIPALVLSSIAENLTNEKSISCSLILLNDNDDLIAMLLILLMGVFRLFVPLIAMIIAILCLLTKLKSMMRQRITNPEKRQVILAIVLTVTYILMSSHRSLFMILHGIVTTYINHANGYFNTLFLGNCILDTSPFLTLSIIYYIISLLRPILCYCISTEVRNTCRSLKSSEDNNI